MIPLFLFSLFNLLLIAVQAGPTSDYKESLLLRPLPQSALLASFHFRSNVSSSSFEQQNFGLFPRSLAQILQHTHAKELHLRFSLGRWDDESWGARPQNGATEGGTGVELWAWVEAQNDEEANARWLSLTNALSGLFCASLNFIDSTKTIRPFMIFQPEGNHSNASMSNLHLLHGTLPHEVVCTENLTPFLKLLPCKGKAGISSLLDGHKLFDSSWQTMSIDVKPVCPLDSSECLLQIEQGVDMVLDLERSKRPRENPIPRPEPIESIVCDTSKFYSSEDSCYPLDGSSEAAWSISEVFGKPLKGACPLASVEGSQEAESVCLNVPSERQVQVQSTAVFSERNVDDFLRCYQLPTGVDFDLILPEQALNTRIPLTPPPLYVSRSINGNGQERGSIQTVLTNPSTTHSVELIYLESLPWFMKLYLHTLRATITPERAEPFRAIKETYFRPAVDRRRATHLEVILSIPPASSVTVTYDFEKAILRYTEYPPDANRGFDAPSAVIRLLSPIPSSHEAKGVYLRTTNLLLYLPTPDFSMPYNVIILTSTVMALGFGSIFNLLVRRFVGADEVEPSKLDRLRALLLGKIMSMRAKVGGKGEKSQ